MDLYCVICSSVAFYTKTETYSLSYSDDEWARNSFLLVNQICFLIGLVLLPTNLGACQYCKKY